MRLIPGKSHANKEDPASETNASDATRDDAKTSASHSDAAFLKLFNASSDLITISSLERCTLLDVNDSFLRVTGYDRDSVVGHTELELGLWPPARDWAKMAEALHRGPVLNVEVTFLTRSGGRRTGLMSAQPIHLGDERCLLTVVKDTTEGRQTEAELGRLSAVVERSKEAVLITGLDGTILYANPAFAEITGYTREQAWGRTPAFSSPASRMLHSTGIFGTHSWPERFGMAR